MNNTYSNNSIKQIIEELKEQEWRTFTIDNSINGVSTTLFIKSLFTVDSYSIIISDLTLVWIKHSDINLTMNDKNRFNPHLDSPIEKILTILRDSIIEKKSGTVYRLSINNNTNNLVFTMSTKISFYTFKWSFECDPIEKIINSDSRKSHSEFIKDHLLMPLLFCCKNQQISNQLLNKKLDKIVNLVNINNGSNTGGNNILVNNSGVATLSVNVGSGGRNINNNSNSNSNINNRKSSNNIYQSILSETQKPEDFSQNDFNNFFKDPIFLQYYNHITLGDDNENQIQDLNSTILDIDNNSKEKSSSLSDFNNNNNNSTNSTATTNEFSLFYEVETTPKKNYNNVNNRNRTNNSVIFNSIPSSLSFIPYSNSQNSSLSSYELDQDYTINENNNRSNTSNNLKLQFEQQQNPQELLEEKKRKLELEEKLEQAKQKQLNKKKKTKFV